MLVSLAIYCVNERYLIDGKLMAGKHGEGSLFSMSNSTNKRIEFTFE